MQIMPNIETKTVVIVMAKGSPDDSGFCEADATVTINVFSRTARAIIEAIITGIDPESGRIRVMYAPEENSIKNKPVSPEEFAEWNPDIKLKIERQ